MSKRTLIITLVASSNPCRKGTKRAKWWGKLTDGMTTAEALQHGVRRKFLRNMRKAGYIKLVVAKKVKVEASVKIAA
jgi:hypothetical protein